MTRRQIATWLVGALLVLCLAAFAAITLNRVMDLPPSDGQRLTAIVQSVERKALGAIQGVEYERDWWKMTGLWEITVCEERCLKLYIDPKSGEERRRKSDDLEDELPPASTQKPSAIAKSFEDGKLGFITEMEFEHGAWQVKFREARGLSGALQPTKRLVFEPKRPAQPKQVPRAAPPAQRDIEQFVGVDANGDGFISWHEAAADERVERRFHFFDLNLDGKLDREEFQALINRASAASESSGGTLPAKLQPSPPK